MNAKTAKLIGKCSRGKRHKRAMKRGWNAMPWTKRSALRLQMQTLVMMRANEK